MNSATQTATPAVDAVFFDMGGVLLNFHPGRIVSGLLQEQENREPGIAQTVCQITLGAPEWRLLDAGCITQEDAIEAMAARFPRYREEIQLVMQHWPDQMQVVDGMYELVSDLKTAGVPLYLLSNASVRFYEYYQRYPIFSLFDGLNISAEMKLIKPYPEIYRTALKRAGKLPERSLFIDDLEENVRGAQSIGMLGYRFQGHHQLRCFLTQLGLFR